MKLSLSWIKDYIDMPADMDLKQLAYDLTMSTVEVEDATDLSKQFDNMVVGIIRSIEQHPNADKLRVCKTDIGGGEIRDIVCGGTNLYEGQRVAVALPGSFCRWHGEGEPVKIKQSKLRGVERYGMICASSEIGLFDLCPFEEGEATILDLSDFDVPAGTPLAEALDLDDIILEIDNKSMTNRPDLWGHYGIAREIAALYDLPLKEFRPFVTDAPLIEHVKVTIDDTESCPRFICAQIDGLSVKPSPFKMQSRRHASHQCTGRHYQLCHAGNRSALPRLRFGQHYRPYHRAPCRRKREAAAAQRQRAGSASYRSGDCR